MQLTALPKEYKKQYDTAFDDYIEFLSNNPWTGKDIENVLTAKHLVELIKHKQICSQAKLERIIEDIRSAVAQGEKVIVFSQFTGTITELQKRLQEEKKASAHGDAQESIKSVILTGSSSMDQRS